MNSPQKAKTSSTSSMAIAVSQNNMRPNRVEASTGCRPETISLMGALTWRPLRKTSTARHFDQSHEHTRPRPDHGHADDLDDGPTPIHHARILGWCTAPCQFDYAHDHFAQAREEQYQCGHGGDGQRDQRIAETMSEP